MRCEIINKEREDIEGVREKGVREKEEEREEEREIKRKNEGKELSLCA